MTQPARRQASHADQARRADATATSARPPPAANPRHRGQAARKAPKCPACLLAPTVLHPYGWAKQGGRYRRRSRHSQSTEVLLLPVSVWPAW